MCHHMSKIIRLGYKFHRYNGVLDQYQAFKLYQGSLNQYKDSRIGLLPWYSNAKDKKYIGAQHVPFHFLPTSAELWVPQLRSTQF